MRTYNYVAQVGSGAIERGRIVGSAPNDVREMLARRGWRLVSMHEVGSDSPRFHDFVAALSARRFRFGPPVDAELMLQQLAVMLGSGLELTPSLRELSIHSPRRREQQLCGELAQALEQGKSFESALADSQAFPPVVMRLVRVGEETGELPIMLQRTADFIEKRRVARGNLLAAVTYPLLVAFAACSVAAYLVGWAIPKLATFLHAMGRKLPAMTQSLLDLSSVVRQYGPSLAIVALVGGVALALVYAWKPGRYRIDKFLLRIPLVGSLMQMAETQQLAGSLALMLRSGVFLPEALQTSALLHRNRYLADRVARSCDQLRTGNDLAGSLGGYGFGGMLASMIAIGERTGELPKALEHVADFYAAQLDARLKRFARLVEPAIIVFVGGIVGYVYVAFFMALLSAGGKFN